MSSNPYSSVLKDELHDFITLRASQGFRDGNRYIWGSLDKYLVSIGAAEKVLTPEIVEGWLSTSCNGLKARSVGGYITHYNAFAKYLISLSMTVFLPEPPLLDHGYVPYIFSSDEIGDIFRIADSGKTIRDKLTRVQFPMLLRILYGCGLRLGEALALRLTDVDFVNGVLHVWNGKGRKDRLVPMDQTLIDTLQMYCNFVLTGKSVDSYLFESNYKDGRRYCIGRPRHSSWAQQNFKRVLEEAKIELLKHDPNERGICLHCLRHTFAVNSFRKQDLLGIDNYRNSPLLSLYLGHYELEGTQKYLHMTAESSEDIIALTTEYSHGLFPEVPQ